MPRAARAGMTCSTICPNARKSLLCTAIGRRIKLRVSEARKIAPQESRKIIS
jgi:hypothetical protein